MAVFKSSCMFKNVGSAFSIDLMALEKTQQKLTYKCISVRNHHILSTIFFKPERKTIMQCVDSYNFILNSHFIQFSFEVTTTKDEL